MTLFLRAAVIVRTRNYPKHSGPRSREGCGRPTFINADQHSNRIIRKPGPRRPVFIPGCPIIWHSKTVISLSKLMIGMKKLQSFGDQSKNSGARGGVLQEFKGPIARRTMIKSPDPMMNHQYRTRAEDVTAEGRLPCVIYSSLGGRGKNAEHCAAIAAADRARNAAAGCCHCPAEGEGVHRPSGGTNTACTRHTRRGGNTT